MDNKENDSSRPSSAPPSTTLASPTLLPLWAYSTGMTGAEELAESLDELDISSPELEIEEPQPKAPISWTERFKNGVKEARASVRRRLASRRSHFRTPTTIAKIVIAFASLLALHARLIEDTIITIGLFLATVASFGVGASFGLILLHLEKHQLRACSTSVIAWIAGVNLLLSFGIPALAGPHYNRIGHRRLLIYGSITFVFGTFISSVFDEMDAPHAMFAALLVSYGILCGAGTGIAMTAVNGILFYRFSDWRGVISGITFMGVSLGGIVWPLILSETLETRGWGPALQTIGGAVLAMLFVAVLCLWLADVRRRNRPADDAEAPRAWYAGPGRLCRVDFLCMTGSLFLFEFVMMGVVGMLPTWADKVGFDEMTIFHVVPIMNAGCGIGRVLVGLLSDKGGPINMAIMAELVAIIVLAGSFFTIEDSVARLYTFAGCWGLSAGSIMSMMTVLVSKLCGEPDNFGLFYGTNSLCMGIAALISVPLNATMLDLPGRYTLVALLCPCCLIALLLMINSRYTYQDRQWRWLEKV